MVPGPGEAASVRERARAKVNLYLHVLGRRDDGYHDLDSLVVFADIGDEIEVATAGETSLEVTGPFAKDVPRDSSNLVLRAVAALAERTGTASGVRVRLTKTLPVAAGIGGGSADAAAALRALGRLWALGPTLAFPAVAQGLGADVPVCLRSRAARIEGTGERIEPAVVPGPLFLVLVHCGIALGTAEVFSKNRICGAPAGDMPDDAGRWPDWLAEQRNDLEAAAMALVPGIGDALAALKRAPGCRLARMSGSGATCFGLFSGQDDAGRAAAAIVGRHPGWWVRACRAQ